MNKKFFVLLTIIVLFFSFLGYFYSKYTSPLKSPSSPSLTQEEEFYYTCPMHPQIHQDHPGSCPICHMPLVKVSSKSHEIPVTTPQLAMIDVAKVKVEARDLEIQIPFSGRMISAQTVSFQVYESDLGGIKPGLELNASSTLHPEAELKGNITSIDSVIDPASRTVRALGSFKGSGHGLLAESTVSGVILIVLKNRLAIPEDAVVHSGRGDLVYLIQDNKLRPSLVKLGKKGKGYFEILSGLSAGDEIASGPNFLIDSESKIRGIQ